ncbi:MAG: hypothetical protein GX121_10190 [Ignavibacteria bacterium]|nr:hypothetical protein [Ignavibacteria bacterium]
MIEIIRKHNSTKDKAILTIDSFLNQLMQQDFPGGIKIKEPVKQWNGDIMSFKFKAKKGFFSASIEGQIKVDEHSVSLTSQLPGIVSSFVSENLITNVINEQFDKLFAG